MTDLPPADSRRFSFGIRFSLLARRWRRGLDRQLAAAGLTDATWVPLVHLQNTGGGISQKALAELVGVDGSSLVRVLDILDRQGLVERRRDARDGRARLIHLTATGQRRVDAIRAELFAAERRMLAGLDDAAIATMLGHFDAIEAAITAMEEDARP